MGAALCLLVHAELSFGARAPQAVVDNLFLLPLPASPAALAVWSSWGARSATLCYDSKFGVGVASARTLPKADFILALWVRSLWVWLQRAGWLLSLSHVAAHSGDVFNDMADHWARQGAL